MRVNELVFHGARGPSEDIIRANWRHGARWTVFCNKDGTYDLWEKAPGHFNDLNNIDVLELAVLLTEFSPAPKGYYPRERPHPSDYERA